jgi:uncharacterized membrane protein YccC
MGEEARAWLFSAKTFGAAMLALGIGFSAGLDRPYWALASVYIASQPQAAATRSKGLYRLLGTVLGACASVALVPNLVNAPALLVAALAGWVGLMLTLALLDRTPRGYVFMLAGYTAAIIGFPSVDAPEDIFSTAVARTEEISLGVVCATLVSSLVFPNHIGPMLARRMERWLADGRRLASDRLRGRPLSDEIDQDRRRLSADVVDIGVLTTQLPFDVRSQRVSMPAVRALHGRLLMLPVLASSIVSRIEALRANGGMTEPTARRVEEMARALERNAEPSALAELIESGAPETSDWRGVLEASLRLRMNELAALLHDCGALLANLRAGRRDLPRLHGDAEMSAGALQHQDPVMALYSGLSAGAAVALICMFWIATGWPEGAVAAQMGAVGCCFFAAQDDPAPAIVRFLWATIAALVVDALYLFAILPTIDGFVMLCVVLAPPFLLYGWLAARPSTSGTGMALAANGATLMALQSTYSADFASFANSGVAAVIGMSTAATVTRLMRSVGADWSAWRLARANWISLADAAEGRGRGDRMAVAGLIIDRIGLIASRSSAITKELAPNLSRLQADLRIGVNIVALRRARRETSAEVVAAIDDVIDGLAGYYRRLARGPIGRPKHGPDPQGLERLDEAIATVISRARGDGERDALQGLVGVRLGLYPDAPPYDEGGAPEPIDRRAAA